MSKVQDIVQRINAALRDVNADSWPEDVIRQAIYEAENAIVMLRPDAAPVDVVFTCVAGIKQSIAALTPSPHRLLSVKYNRVGDVDGRSVRRVGIGDLDAIRPNWRSDPASTTIREFLTDEREPLLFYVNPPAAVGAKLQLSYSSIPAPYVDPFVTTTMTTVSSIYDPMIFEWSLYRLFGHDVEGSVNLSRSQQHLNTFNAMMGIKQQVDIEASSKNLENRR